MLTKSLRGAVAAIAMVAAPSAFAGSNLIVNGDFSNPNLQGGYIEAAGIPGWTATGSYHGTYATVEVGSSGLYGLPCISAGCQNLEVNGNTWGDDYQIVTGLKKGETYNLSFDYGIRDGGGPDTLYINIGDRNLGRIDTYVGEPSVWLDVTYSFIAYATSEKLSFISGVTDGSASYGNEIANVSLTGAVPEASTWAMLDLGFVGLVFIGVARRNTSARFAL